MKYWDRINHQLEINLYLLGRTEKVYLSTPVLLHLFYSARFPDLSLICCSSQGAAAFSGSLLCCCSTSKLRDHLFSSSNRLFGPIII
jgi:hypothetical protein